VVLYLNCHFVLSTFKQRRISGNGGGRGQADRRA
jgi:hypothetical protein